MKKIGFTLAEVLIVIGIIGIVAEMTIPTLMNNVTDTAYRSQWRKTFSVLANATNQMIAETNDIWDDSSATPSVQSSNMRSAFRNYLRFANEDTVANLLNASYKLYKNNSAVHPWPVSTDPLSAATLADGSVVKFGSYQECTNTSVPAEGGGTLTNICGYFAVDVNGRQGPNMIGKDLYWAWIIRPAAGYKVVPFGALDDGSSCSPSANYLTSDGCSATALGYATMP